MSEISNKIIEIIVIFRLVSCLKIARNPNTKDKIDIKNIKPNNMIDGLADEKTCLISLRLGILAVGRPTVVLLLYLSTMTLSVSESSGFKRSG